MKQILTFHYHGTTVGEKRMLPVYYIEADYAPVAVRIHAEVAPSTRDAKIDIFDDGVSIFENRVSTTTVISTGLATTGVAATAAVLGKAQNTDEYAEDFGEDTLIAQGSLVYCNLVEAGSGGNFTVHLELERVSEDSEPEE